jgi:polyisoprenyl-phosphate glycosyltransferase
MAQDKIPVVCIIPAYNEEHTVASIARLASSHPLIGRVIVVDDGSSDSTASHSSEINDVKVISLTPNKGKGAAMRAGMSESDEPVILFLDADLIGLNEQHISDLLSPVINNEADMSVGLFRGGRLHTDLAHVITPSLSGQRAIRREVIQNMDMDSVGFGIERALTELWQNGSIRVKEVILRGVTHRTKEEKRGYWPGVKQRLKMYYEILRFEFGRLKRKQ